MTALIIILTLIALYFTWKAGNRGEGMIEGYEIGRRYERKLTEPKEQYIIRIEEHNLN